MPENSDMNYHARRERQERTLAAASANPAVRAIHLDFAERYAAIVDGTNIVAFDSAARRPDTTSQPNADLSLRGIG